MSYLAFHGRHVDDLHEWAVVDQDTAEHVGGPYAWFTEAEASVIAFALQAVSEWRCLEAHAVGFSNDAYTYEGPYKGLWKGRKKDREPKT